MSGGKFCWPDGHGKIYCMEASDYLDEDIGIYLAEVTEEEYPIQYCAKYLEEAKNNESNLSCSTDASK